MATDSRDRRVQDAPQKSNEGQKNAPDVEQEAPEKKAGNADQAKEGMPGYGQPPEEVRKPLPEQDW
jgi:hypothetical protein